MKLKRHGAVIGTAALVLAGTATLAGGGAADAAPPTYRTLTVSPSSGSTTNVNLEFDTNAQCPAPSSAMIVRLYGSGLPSGGENLMGNTSLGIVPKTGTHPVASITFKQALQNNGVIAPNGGYTVKALCVNNSGTTTYAEFVGNVTFTHGSAANYEASWTSSVDAPATETVLSAIGNTTYGTSVTLTATVSAGTVSGTPAVPSGGSVQFLDGADPIGDPVSIDGAGVATLSTRTIDPGSHSITAQYLPGGASYGGSTSAARTFSVATASSFSNTYTCVATGATVPVVATLTPTIGTLPSATGAKVLAPSVAKSIPAAVSTGVSFTVPQAAVASLKSAGVKSIGVAAPTFALPFGSKSIGLTGVTTPAAKVPATVTGPLTLTAAKPAVNKAFSMPAPGANVRVQMPASFAATVNIGTKLAATCSLVTPADQLTLGTKTVVKQGSTLTAKAPASVAKTAAVVVSALVKGANVLATGSVSVAEGATALGSATLDAKGKATITVAGSTLPPGSHTLTVSYAGDSATNAATSASVTVVVKTK